jgi:hypothetical protein
MDVADFEDDEPPLRKSSTPQVPPNFDSVSTLLQRQLELLDPLKNVRGALVQLETAAGFQRLLREQEDVRQTLARRFDGLAKASDIFKQQQAILASSFADRYAALTTSHSTNLSSEVYERLKGQSRALEEASRIPRDMQRWIADLADGQGLRHATSVAEQWHASTSESLKLFERYRNPLANLATGELFESIARRAKLFDRAQADISALAAQVTEARVAEASQDAQTIVLQAANEPTLQGALDQILAAIEANRDTLARRLLWFVLVPLLLLMIAAVVNPLADHYIKGKLSASGQGAEKLVKKRAAQTVGDLRVLSDYRYVRASVLTVRVNAKARAPSVGQLQFGQAVLVLEIRGAFTQVLWTSSDGTSQLRGWVFSRHLRKFT